LGAVVPIYESLPIKFDFNKSYQVTLNVSLESSAITFWTSWN